MTIANELDLTIAQLVQHGKGILAADESLPTIAKRFAAIDLESTPENRRAYREILFSTAGLEAYISGVIAFEETLTHRQSNGAPLCDLLCARNIVLGVKVDKGFGELALSQGDQITFGLDDLAKRLTDYKSQGAGFAKWRNVYRIGDHIPSSLGMRSNAEVLARYAAECQALGIVPMIEPEVLMDGAHSLEDCAQVTENVLKSVFAALHEHNVILERIILKTNLVLPGKEHPTKANPERIAASTMCVLRRTVPAAVPSINFLSGGLSAQKATQCLQALNATSDQHPWLLSFSFGRALQQPVLDAWRGQAQHRDAAQEALLTRARLNSEAQRGVYKPETDRDTQN